MNLYTKPTAILLAASGSRAGASGCTSSAEDLEILKDVFGITDIKKAFGIGEACEDQYPIEAYCKFTAADAGATAVFTS